MNTSISFDGDVASRIANKLTKLDLKKCDSVRMRARIEEGIYDDITVQVIRVRGRRDYVSEFVVRERRKRSV